MSDKPQNSVETSRKKAHLTQAQLASSVGVTRQTIIAIEKGNYTPSVLLALKLTKVLKKKMEELFWLWKERKRANFSVEVINKKGENVYYNLLDNNL